jgi:hypothetical protein
MNCDILEVTTFLLDGGILHYPSVYSSPVFTSEHMESQRQERSNPGLPFDNLVPCRGFEGVNGPYNTMVEVPTIRRDSGRMKEAARICSRLTKELHLCSLADAIVQFASLVSIHRFYWIRYSRLILYWLEAIDLRRMSNKEKITFRVNIHNALLMHVILY